MGVTQMKIKDGYVIRNIAGSNIVVPVGKEASVFNGMITLNDSAAFLWKCFLNDITKQEAKDLLMGEYEVDESRAVIDIDKFTELLLEHDLLDKK